jgi:hypothetical protein
MANFVYNYGKFLLANGNINLLTDNIAVLLVANTYISTDAGLTGVANNNSNTVHEITSYEVTTGTVSAYARQNLASKTITEDDTNDFAYLSAANVTFSTLGTGNTIGGAVLFKQGADNNASPLIAFYDITDTPTNGGDITIQWAAAASGGVLKLA